MLEGSGWDVKKIKGRGAGFFLLFFISIVYFWRCVFLAGLSEVFSGRGIENAFEGGVFVRESCV
ncbi:hypothetical protein [Desulfobotulus alkaliphilus]|uniref:hypothetical protein n=1 Tax=Desulfobotulus alkaliphilus TaxID=622671 RepID=UPI0011A82279|nr:hypothetical protein [Desulfobotulus alkaliphilus]